jgi:hypothetical protein
MVLIGLIIIALTLMAFMMLAVSGGRQKLLMPAGRRAGRGTARKPGR